MVRNNKKILPLAVIVFGVLFFLAGLTTFSNIVFFVFGVIIILVGLWFWMKARKKGNGRS